LVGFSAMSRLEVRYLETLTPAIAIALGVGVVALVDAAMHQRRWLPLAALAVTTAYLVYLARGDAALVGVLLVAAVAAAALTVTRPVPVAAGALVMIALLAVPTSDSIAIVRDHRFDHSTGGGYLTAAQTAALSRYLTAHRAGERYEAAVLTVWQAANLIVTDGRPVLATRNVDGAPMLSVAALRDEVDRGALRYVLVGTPCMKRPGPRCPPASRWAKDHGTPVRGVVPRLGLYRVGAAR